MGLTMYLYKVTRKSIEDLKRLKKVEDDLNKIWEPIISNELPKNWYCDKSNMPENQRKLYDEMYNELDIIEQKRSAILNEMNVNIDECNDGYIGYWRNFNYLHQYIVDNFSDGVDDGQVIPLTKDNIVQILNHLNKIDDVLSSLNKNGFSGLGRAQIQDTYNISINVDQIANDYDVERMIKQVKKELAKDGRYRNVNAVSRIR